MSSLSWSSLSPGQTNKSASAALRLNNTGNKIMSANTTQINATNLRGETTTTVSIWSGNISVSWDATALEACDTSGGDGIAANLMMKNSTHINITTANLTKGNYILNDGSTGQEDYYFCIKTIGAELTSQQYSTVNAGPWQVRILLVPFIFGLRKRKNGQNIKRKTDLGILNNNYKRDVIK